MHPASSIAIAEPTFPHSHTHVGCVLRSTVAYLKVRLTEVSGALRISRHETVQLSDRNEGCAAYLWHERFAGHRSRSSYETIHLFELRTCLFSKIFVANGKQALGYSADESNVVSPRRATTFCKAPRASGCATARMRVLREIGCSCTQMSIERCVTYALNRTIPDVSSADTRTVATPRVREAPFHL
jgi:hypothetical protein